jgi:hypothetical protein
LSQELSFPQFVSADSTVRNRDGGKTPAGTKFLISDYVSFVGRDAGVAKQFTIHIAVNGK